MVAAPAATHQTARSTPGAMTPSAAPRPRRPHREPPWHASEHQGMWDPSLEVGVPWTSARRAAVRRTQVPTPGLTMGASSSNAARRAEAAQQEAQGRATAGAARPGAYPGTQAYQVWPPRQRFVFLNCRDCHRSLCSWRGHARAARKRERLTALCACPCARRAHRGSRVVVDTLGSAFLCHKCSSSS